MDVIKINKLELASQLAHNTTKDEMLSKGFIVDENEMYQPEYADSEGLIYTEEAQDIFMIHYDYFLEMIENAEV